MNEGYKFLRDRDRIYSEWLAVRESIKATSIKPSGTVSILASVTPGVHWPKSSGLYIRRVRFAANDPLVDELIKAGYEIEPSVDDPKFTVVATFVTKGNKVRSELEVSLWEKAELAVLAQRWWADNQVSATLTFQEHEADQIGPLLASKEGQFKGVSFLPIGEDEVYAQAPYEKIAEQDAEDYMAKISSLGDLYKSGMEAIGDKFCDTDVCEIKL
jgi:ssRNA-specific RNase YbeY (16S rRNA maturation enzyme)